MAMSFTLRQQAFLLELIAYRKKVIQLIITLAQLGLAKGKCSESALIT